MTLLNTTCGCIVNISEGFEPETITYQRALEKRLGDVRDIAAAFDVVVKLAKVGGGAAITISTAAGATTATDSRLASKSIIFLSGSGFTVPYNPPLSVDSTGTFSFPDGFPGGPVTIFYQ